MSGRGDPCPCREGTHLTAASPDPPDDPYNQQASYGAGAGQRHSYGDPYASQQQGQYPQASRSPPLPARSPSGGYNPHATGQGAPYDPYTADQQSYGVPYTTSYANPAPAAALAAAAHQPYASSRSPPLASPPARTSWPPQDAYGGMHTAAAGLPQPLPAPHAQHPQAQDRSTAFGLDEGYEHIIANAQAGRQPSQDHYGAYNDPAHPTGDGDDDGENSGPRPPSYDSAAGTYQNRDQGSSSRQQAWPTAANEKSGR